MAGSSKVRASLTALSLVVLLAAVVFALDQYTKMLALENLELGVPTPVLGEFLKFTLVMNPGAAFSIASGATWIFSIAASAVFVAILIFAPRLRSRSWVVFFGLLLGGVLGNLFDRLFREPGFGTGHVVDMIQVWMFPAIFNVADIFIVGSMGFFVLLSLLGIRMDGTRDSDHAAADVEVAEADEADAEVSEELEDGTSTTEASGDEGSVDTDSTDDTSSEVETTPGESASVKPARKR